YSAPAWPSRRLDGRSVDLLRHGTRAHHMLNHHQIIDVWGWRRWATMFIWIGANAIMLYFLNEVLGFEPFVWRFVGGDFASFLNNSVTQGAGGFVTHVLGVVFAIALAGFLYRRKIFLRV